MYKIKEIMLHNQFLSGRRRANYQRQPYTLTPVFVSPCYATQVECYGRVSPSPAPLRPRHLRDSSVHPPVLSVTHSRPGNFGGQVVVEGQVESDYLQYIRCSLSPSQPQVMKWRCNQSYVHCDHNHMFVVVIVQYLQCY